MQVHASFDNDHPEAGAGNIADIAAAMKGEKQFSSVGLWDSDPTVTDNEYGVRAILANSKIDGCALWRVFYGVGEQVGEDEANQRFIGQSGSELALLVK